MCRGAREMDKYELIEYRESEDETVRLLKSATNFKVGIASGSLAYLEEHRSNYTEHFSD
jgi:hypothetical protein